MKKFCLILGLCIVLPMLAQAEAPVKKNPFRSTAYPLPRFASLDKDEAYVRTGPGPQYPVKWIYKKAGLPVEIILEYEHWRKIRDFSGDVGWTHKSMLSGKRTALVKRAAALLEKPRADAAPIAELRAKSLLTLKSCDGSWCRGAAGGFEGWLPQKSLWGVYEGERLD